MPATKVFSKKSVREFYPTITQTFVHRIRKSGDKKAFHVKKGTQWHAHTWNDFYKMVREIAAGLLDLGIQPQNTIAILAQTRIEWAACDMAIMGAKAVTVPIYSSNTAEDSLYILDHCDATCIIVEDLKQLEKVTSIRSQLTKLKHVILIDGQSDQALTLSKLREAGQNYLKKQSTDVIEHNLMTIQPTDIFTICYTSGTTGAPKGVVLTHENLMSVVTDVDRAVGSELSEADSTLSFLPISHIFGKVESMITYHFGWQVYYAESVEKILINLAEVGPTILVAVPRVFEKAYSKIKSSLEDASPLKMKLFSWAMGVGKRYYQAIWDKESPTIADTIQYQIAKRLVFDKVYQKFGGRIRYCIAGGAPLSKEVGEFMRILGLTILEGYGLTETCAPVTLNTPNAIQFGTIGKPLPEVQLRIAEDGEILIKSKKVFREYYKNEDATRSVLSDDGWFRTGDIGVIDNDGFVKITDRKKDIIVTSGGKNIAPQKIENLLKAASRFISQVIVSGDRRNYLTALVVLEKDEVIKFAKSQNILFSEYPELLKHQKVLSLVQSVFDQVNKRLASFETVKRFKLLSNEFTIDSGELTPSLKVKRKFCTEKYGREIDSMYNQPAL